MVGSYGWVLLRSGLLVSEDSRNGPPGYRDKFRIQLALMATVSLHFVQKMTATISRRGTPNTIYTSSGSLAYRVRLSPDWWWFCTLQSRESSTSALVLSQRPTQMGPIRIRGNSSRGHVGDLDQNLQRSELDATTACLHPS